MNDACFSLHLSPYPAFRLETPTLQATAWRSQFPQSVSCITAIRPQSLPIGFKSAKKSMKTELPHRSTPCVGPPKSRLDAPQTPHHSRKRQQNINSRHEINSIENAFSPIEFPTYPAPFPCTPHPSLPPRLLPTCPTIRGKR